MATDNDDPTRRTFIASVAGVAAGVALPVTALAQHQGNPPEPIDEQLGAIGNQLGRIGARLERLDALQANPPQPIRVANLETIRTEAEELG